jgi:hypothetical protein
MVCGRPGQCPHPHGGDRDRRAPGSCPTSRAPCASAASGSRDAKVATFGERVEDIFYITDSNDQPVQDLVKLECLRYSITIALAQP